MQPKASQLLASVPAPPTEEPLPASAWKCPAEGQKVSFTCPASSNTNTNAGDAITATNSTTGGNGKCSFQPLFGGNCWAPEMKRIYGGASATEGQFPYHVLILTLKGGTAFGCSGTILSSSWVLTAAHCMCTEGKTTTRVVIKYGSASQSSALRQEVKRFIVHPRFAKNESPFFMVNDIALLELCVPLDMSLPGVKPICFTKEDLAYSGTVTVTGWGKTPGTIFPESLQHVDLNIYPVNMCKRLYNIFKAGIRDEWNKICTFTKDKYPCDGDSGGPLVAEVSPGCHIQLGITSYGTCTSILPNVATKLSSFADWICESTSLC